jgi:glycosyltransferase involved in cell wall biosynthesis
MDKHPMVSVIIPTYNRVNKVGNAIESAIRQTYPNKEIIVVDDGSTDDTPKLMEKYPQVKYKIIEHGGQAAARNSGLKLSSGKYITSLDSDDVWNEDFLSSCVEAIERHNLDFVFTNWSQDAGNGDYVDPFSTYNFFKPYLKGSNEEWNILENDDLRTLYISGCPSPSSSLMIRRSSIVSEWNNILKIADDWCIIMDIIFSKECRAAFTKRKLWIKNIDGTNIHDGRNEKELLKYLYVHDMEIMYNRYKKDLIRREKRTYKESLTYYLTMYAFQQLTIDRSFKSCLQPFKKAFITNPKQALTLFLIEVKGRSQKRLVRLMSSTFS